MKKMIGIAIVTAGLGQCGAIAFAQAPLARPLKPADTLATRDIGDIAVSPDGSKIVYALSTPDLVRNSTTNVLMLLGESNVLASNGSSTPRWSPDGTRLAYIAGNSDPATALALFVVNFSGGTRRVIKVCDFDRSNAFISKAGNSLSWSPDGSRLAFTGTLEPRPAPADPLIVTRLQYKTRTSFSDNRRTHVYVVDALEHATPKPLTVGAFDNHSIAWGGDGSEIVFLSNRQPDPDATLNYDIYAVNVRTAALRQMTKTPGVEMDPVVSPDGKSIAYIATTRPVTTIDSVAEDAHVFVVPMSGGPPRELNHALDRRSASPVWAPDGASVLFTASDHGKTLIYRVPADGGASKPLFDRKAQAGGVSVARDGTIVFGMTDASTPRELFRLSPGATAPAPLTKLNADLIASWKLVAPETITFKSFDGTDVEGWFYPALEAHGRAPMILNIHGGPHGGFGYAFNPGFQLNASHGYATLAINPRGSSGYGQAFSDGCVNNWGGGDYKDLMAGVDAVLKTHQTIDPARLGVMGGSYGGFMTNWVITQTPRFKAAVSSASLSNLISFYATSLYQDLVHAEFNGFPWDGDNDMTLWKWSPIAHVKNVTTPTLFIHGEQDNDVHITQAEEMFTALRRRGIEAALARYPREGHGFHEPQHRLDATIRTLEWMDRFLMPKDAKPTAQR
jgi:dipeptidyl aminopeptidase/acylaminoacyl peptidase